MEAVPNPASRTSHGQPGRQIRVTRIGADNAGLAARLHASIEQARLEAAIGEDEGRGGEGRDVEDVAERRKQREGLARGQGRTPRSDGSWAGSRRSAEYKREPVDPEEHAGEDDIGMIQKVKK